MTAKSSSFGLGQPSGDVYIRPAQAPVSATERSRRLDDEVVRRVRGPTCVLACCAALIWLLSLWVSWPSLASHPVAVLGWTLAQLAGLGLCLGAQDAKSHDGGVGLMTVAMAGGCRFQVNAFADSAGELWVLPLCLMLSLVLGLVQVRLRSYLICSLAVWLVLAHEFVPRVQGSEQALRGVLPVGGFILALLLHRGVALARRRRMAAATTQATLAYQDALTGLANRRGFLLTAEARLRLPQQQGLIALDVDDFKRINDRHGHEVGDRLLQAVGALLLRLPAHALAGRTGGEEFCILVPAATHAELAGVAQGVVEGARGLSAQGVGLTLSAGAALVQAGESVEQVLRRADAALGQAKRTGKNRLVLSDGAAR